MADDAQVHHLSQTVCQVAGARDLFGGAVGEFHEPPVVSELSPDGLPQSGAGQAHQAARAFLT
jgi:hypothetical protein